MKDAEMKVVGFDPNDVIATSGKKTTYGLTSFNTLFINDTGTSPFFLFYDSDIYSYFADDATSNPGYSGDTLFPYTYPNTEVSNDDGKMSLVLSNGTTKNWFDVYKDMVANNTTLYNGNYDYTKLPDNSFAFVYKHRPY